MNIPSPGHPTLWTSPAERGAETSPWVQERTSEYGNVKHRPAPTPSSIWKKRHKEADACLYIALCRDLFN